MDRKNNVQKQRQRKRQKQKLLSALSECGNLIKASLTINRRRCGNPRCRCSRGHLHESLAITYKQTGKSMLVHVPEDMQEKARAASHDYQQLKKLVAQISRINIEEFKQQTQKPKAKHK